MKTTSIREQIYEFIEMYVDTPEPKKLCSSIEDLVEELAESKVKILALPNVSNRTWVVTIGCGEITEDWKITAPNELAAKITASSNYNGKRFNVLRCVEYGC